MKKFSFWIVIFIIGIGFWLFMLGIGIFTVVMPAKRDVNLPYYLPIILKNANGIQKGTRIHILGMDQGYVYYLDYFPVDKQGNLIFISECKHLCREKIYDQIVFVVLNIRKKLEFYSNYELYTRYDNVIGEKILEINPGSKFIIKNNKKNYQSQLSVYYLNSNEILNLLTNRPITLNKNQLLFSTNYDDPVTLIAEVIYENKKPLRRIFRNLANITGKINKGNGTIASLINQDQLIINSDQVLLEAILLLGTIREGYETIRENKIISNALGGVLPYINSNQPTLLDQMQGNTKSSLTDKLTGKNQ